MPSWRLNVYWNRDSLLILLAAITVTAADLAGNTDSVTVTVDAAVLTKTSIGIGSDGFAYIGYIDGNGAHVLQYRR